ncbi:molybdopterin synthase sulfur carrier subunit [Shewanella sp. 202IG2-18]|uniref:molybdopterin synthase sulfur carrier subunit n=1 Tax=Parashewanella hymeniacidonis TaxID=2807618 RepID=UPI0019621E33|nr:molybdopterin synthase sulfur carrier subunit [Parashewanella hymeniacidonis]MBM7071736.1 molybdopterin synthase sulfur carrier subunit [Parashewanella hymeniacidonis]
MITILFFAQVRERLGEAKLELEYQDDWQHAEQIRAKLCERGAKWASTLSSDKLLVAVNQELCSLDQTIKDGDEIAFFPPVTGG